MGKSQVLAVLALASFLLILFTPINTNYWKWLLFFGIIMGVFWFFKK